MGMVENLGKNAEKTVVKAIGAGGRIVGKTVSEFIRGLNTDEFHVLMLGGRRCGKTSVLATIIHDFNSLPNSDLHLTWDPANGSAMTEKYEEMERYVASSDNIDIVIDDNPSAEIDEHKFSVTLKAHPGNKIDLSFIDVPGEYMKDKNTVPDMKRLVSCANVFIVAIDTPYLMEEDGKYAKVRNFCGAVCNWLAQVNASDEFVEKTGKKMVLFVPMKCEKYMRAGKMDDVNKKIKDCYKEAFNYFSGSIARNCIIAITPMATMGVMEFGVFERNEEGEIKENGGIPTARYWKPDTSKKELEPKFCEQPVYYLLAYILKSAAEKHPKRDGFLGTLQWLKNTFLKMANAKDWLNQTEWVLKNIKTRGDGYEIISDPLHFN